MSKDKEEKSEEKSEDYKRIDLAKRLNDITFKNEQVKTITDLQSENTKLRNMVGRNKSGRRQANIPTIQGLGTLKGNLGRQFLRKTD